MNTKFYFTLFLTFITSFGFVNHQVSAATVGTSTQAAPYSCPSYGQEIVGVSLSGPSGSVIAGTDVPLSIRLTNLTNYPLVGGAVLVRVFSNSFSDKALSSISSPILFERFFPITNMSIGAGDTRKATFSLSLRDKLPAGSYIAIASYVSSAQFNAENPDAPLSEISGSNAYAFTFKVIPANQNNKSLVYFDNKSIVIGEAKDGVVTATVDLVNTSSAQVTVPVLWKLNYWNYPSDDTFIKSSVVSAVVPASSRKKLSYTLDVSKRSVYQIVGQTEYAGVRSFTSFSVDGSVGESIVRFMSIVPFPAAHGGQATVFGCVSNTYSNTKDNGTLYVTVTDNEGNLLDRGIFDIPMGWQFDFWRKFDLKGKTNINVSTDIFSSRGLTQHFELSFDCDKPGKACPAPTTTNQPGGNNSSGAQGSSGELPYRGIAFLVGGIIGVLITRAVFRRKPTNIS